MPNRQKRSLRLARFLRVVGFQGCVPLGLEGKRGGIPHLAKNERDVGHPAVIAGKWF